MKTQQVQKTVEPTMGGIHAKLFREAIGRIEVAHEMSRGVRGEAIYCVLTEALGLLEAATRDAYG